MDPILEVRMWWAYLIVFCGVFLPLICLMCIYIFATQNMLNTII